MTIILSYIDVLCAMRCVHLIQVAALVKAEERTWGRCSTVMQKVEASDKMESRMYAQVIPKSYYHLGMLSDFAQGGNNSFELR